MQIISSSAATSDAGSSGTFGNFTSSTFGFRNGSIDIGGVNADGSAYTVLVFQNVENFSKIGSYTGNGSTDGPFVYCGFRPAWVMIKNVDQLSDWVIYDSARKSFNPMGFRLYANEAFQESGLTSFLDFVSNGVKIVSGSSFNNTNIKYIFMAFAEQPFKFSNAR